MVIITHDWRGPPHVAPKEGRCRLDVSQRLPPVLGDVVKEAEEVGTMLGGVCLVIS